MGLTFFRPESTSSFGTIESTTATSAGSTGLGWESCPRQADAKTLTSSSTPGARYSMRFIFDPNRWCNDLHALDGRALQHVRIPFVRARLRDVGRDFQQWLQNECPLVHARVRDGEIGLAQNDVVVKQNVYVDDARRVAER